MSTRPHPYQLEGVEAIKGFGGRALLADEMGLGKTLTSLLFAKQTGLRPIVVVCPSSLKWNWEREAKVHVGLRSSVLEGTKPKTGMIKPSPVIILNYDILPFWVKHLTSLRPQVLIVDEAHMVANRKAKRSKAVRKLASKIPNVLCLSGTPLTNRPSELWHILHILRPDLYPQFWSYAFEFCLPPDAPILTSDLIEKPISEIKIGDSVVGWGQGERKQRRLVHSKVLDVVIKIGTLQKVTLQSGEELVCTPDHKWHTGGRTGRRNEYMIARTGKAGGQGRKDCASKVMKVFRGTAPLYQETNDYMLGYIVGFFRGDGHCVRRTDNRFHLFKDKTFKYKTIYSIGCACKDIEPIKRVSKYLSYFEIRHSVKQRQTDGLHCVIKLGNKKTYLFLKGAQRDTDEWWAGFLGGIYDAEGSGRSIGQRRTKNAVTYNMIEQGLARFQIKTSSYEDSIFMLGSRDVLIKFWNVANPTLRRKLKKLVFSTGGKLLGGGVARGTAPIVTKIDPLPGEHLVYTLTTSTGNYVAYGCGSKNCNPKKTFWGWDVSRAANLPKLHNNLKKHLMIRRRKVDVLSQLPEKQRGVVVMEPKDLRDYNAASHDFRAWMRKNNPGKDRAKKAEMLVKMGYLKRLAGQIKLTQVMEWIDNFLNESDGKIVVFAIHRNIIAELRSRYGTLCVVVDGSVTGRKRQEAVDKFQMSDKIRVFIGNIKAAGVGLNLTAANNVVFAELGWTPGEHTQAEDRCHRLGTKKNVQVTYFAAKGTIEESLVSLIQTKQKTLNAVLDDGQAEDFDLVEQLAKELAN